MTRGAATTAAVAPLRWRKERREIDSGLSIGFLDLDTVVALRKGSGRSTSVCHAGNR
jgi:hypothetical protein